MRRSGKAFIYTASDLSDSLECEHLTALERAVALGELERPEATPTLDLLARKGAEHEARQLERFRERYGDGVATPSDERDTEGAMESGAPIIYQAAFSDGTFSGRADFLRRVERRSERWPWSYEVLDSKLALSPKPTYLIQLAHYSEHVARISGTMPESMSVILGSGAERSFRVEGAAAYYRHVKARFLERMNAGSPTYPAEVKHCGVCRWSDRCASRRNRDDHLSLVARIRRDQIAKLEGDGITTMTALARAEQRPFGMGSSTFATIQAQARLQHEARVTGELRYELLDASEGAGFALLPEPDEGDVFFDMEGDPLFAPERGLEYLFGIYLAKEREYVAFWAHAPSQEREAFAQCVDFLIARRERYPRMHVYHYAAYEATALRRLMGYYGTREAHVDSLLRNETLIDLFPVVRQSLRVSQPSYSIKKLEPYYGFRRDTNVQRGDDSIVMFESWLIERDDAILRDIERYNADDCRSTAMLRDWLLERRAEYADQRGFTPPWREPVEKAAPSDDGRGELADALLAGLEPPASPGALYRSEPAFRARWLLGHLLGYHSRENKPAYWKLYDRYDNPDELLEFDHEALAGLELLDLPPERDKQSFIYTYRYPPQQHNLGNGDPHCPRMRKRAGSIVELDDDRRIVRLKVSRNAVPAAITALIPAPPIENGAARSALARLARAQLDGSLERRYAAARDLLLAEPPRFLTPRAVVQPETIDDTSLAALARDLDRSYLVLQGPPGTGKSTFGAALIVDLLAAGKRVGIVSGGHKAIHNLLHKVEERARERRVAFTGLQKHSGDESQFVSHAADSTIRTTASNDDFAQPHDLAAGTPWLFAREDRDGAYDYLVIDEAGQLSLADALACSTAAHNVILLGDPMQLAQVSQGSHPAGTGRSILEHLLAGRDTVDPARGVFLDRSFRLAPPICAFISEGVYENRLRADERCARNAVSFNGTARAGLAFVPVEHQGNDRASDEEARAVVELAGRLLAGTVDLSGTVRPMTERDVLVVAPYNAHRKLLRRRLTGAGYGAIAVGTVDKFQGQEAPVVIYSMATSSGATLPRDMEFLFEKNRLNVAISRAQCMSVLVCSPELLGVRCTSPEQVELANLLCSFVERAQRVTIADYSTIS